MTADISAAHGAFIRDVLREVERAVSCRPQVHGRVLDYHLRALATTKAFRPALVQAFSRLHACPAGSPDRLWGRSGQAGAVPDRRPTYGTLVQRAAALQLMHEGTLLADDVIDHSPLRRGQRAAHMRYGRIPACGAGGWLGVRAMQMCLDSRPVSEAILQALEDVTVAESLQWQARNYSRPIPLEVWQEIARGDTGALFRLAAVMAGWGWEELDRYVVPLTFLYHGLDDLQDLEDEAGSDLGGGRNADLRDDIPTLQTCFTAGRDEAALRATHDRCRAWLTEVASVSRPPELDVFFQALNPAHAPPKEHGPGAAPLLLDPDASHGSV